jgi:hypothetical protein
MKLKQPLEYSTHVGVADALRVACAPGWMWTHFPAGEHRTGMAGVRLFKMGLKRGWADFLLLDAAGRLYCLELKRGNAPLTGDQEVFEAACLARGIAYEIARSLDQALGILTRWGALSKLRITA